MFLMSSNAYIVFDKDIQIHTCVLKLIKQKKDCTIYSICIMILVDLEFLLTIGRKPGKQVQCDESYSEITQNTASGQFGIR